jgi:hypothetical protein
MKKIITINIFITLFISCNNNFKTNVPQSSFDIKQSKEKEVFISEYIPSITILNFNEKIVKIKCVWSEHLWSYSNFNKEINKEIGANGYIKFQNNDIDIYEFSILYGKDFLYKGGITDNKLSFNSNTTNNNIQIKIIHKTDTIQLNLKHILEKNKIK